jgi:hypothetical protein
MRGRATPTVYFDISFSGFISAIFIRNFSNANKHLPGYNAGRHQPALTSTNVAGLESERASTATGTKAMPPLRFSADYDTEQHRRRTPRCCRTARPASVSPLVIFACLAMDYRR